MGWNYRIIHHDVGEHSWYGIHEVYYKDNGDVRCYSTKPDPICGEELDSLDWMLEHMNEAATKPVLKESDLNKLFEEFNPKEEEKEE